MNIFNADIRCQLYGYLIIQKTSILYIFIFYENIFSFLRKHAANVIKYEKKKMLLLTKKELKLYCHAGACYICGKKVCRK